MDNDFYSAWIASELSQINATLRGANPLEKPGNVEVYENLSPYELAVLMYDFRHYIPWSIARHFRQKSIWELTGIHADEW
ncbi:MAG: hypothetical protein LUI10_12275 [Lachnospiraceae bacterium]|nr:hypothetical protein [Lachnospiraceae bacterium]